MNKKLIKDNKEAFDHWLNGGKVISKYTLIPTWSSCQSEDIWRIPDKNISKVLIVINDEYATYRKALAEGKTIQYMNSNGEIKSLDEWDNIGWKQFKGCVENYRIKPEEPKFKVGDWVRNRINEIGQILQEDYKGKGLYKISNTHALKCEVGTSAKDLTIWVPKSGELVILKDKNSIISIIKYNGETDVCPFIGEITWLHKKD